MDLECKCNSKGSTSVSCDVKGICSCKTGFMGSQCGECKLNVTGDKCDKCKPNTFNYPNCQG